MDIYELQQRQYHQNTLDAGFTQFSLYQIEDYHLGRSTHTGNYNQVLFYQSLSISEITSNTFFKYKKVKYLPTNEKVN